MSTPVATLEVTAANALRAWREAEVIAEDLHHQWRKMSAHVIPFDPTLRRRMLDAQEEATRLRQVSYEANSRYIFAQWRE